MSYRYNSNSETSVGHVDVYGRLIAAKHSKVEATELIDGFILSH